MSNKSFTKWVACWGNATSITDRREAVYAKDITLRYPVRVVFSGSALRFHFSNLTGSEDVTVTKAYAAVTDSSSYQPVKITQKGNTELRIPAGKEIISDPLPLPIEAGQNIEVSMYFGNFTQMNAGTVVTGPLSQAYYAYGDFSESKSFPDELSRPTNTFYFLNTIDVLTEEKNHALVCYGDSITAQSWPDYLAIRAWEKGFHNVSIIRRAVCGTRILRQYDNITYASYGLKGETRFPVEVNTAGARDVIIHHGINDIIHPVGVEVNKFRPWEDMPTSEDLQKGVEDFYVSLARKLGLNVWSATLLPIYGWRTYAPFRDEIRNKFNDWLRSSNLFDGCIDFDRLLQDPEKKDCFKDGYDSGDHLHPSEKAYKAMADYIPEGLLQ